MNGRKRIIASLALAVAGAALGQEAPESPAATRSPLETLRAAQQAFAAESYAEALEHYEQLRSTMPDTPEVPYNMGVAAYRAGDLRRAAELFDEALALANDPEMLARSAYNLGTTAYARALEPPEPPEAPDAATPSPPGAAGATAQLDRAAEALGEALGHFRRALDVDAGDEDARANAELAQRMLQRIEEMKQQQQQSDGEPQEGEQQEGEQQEGEQQEGEPQEGSASTDRTESGEPDEPQQSQGEQQGQPESAPPTEGEEQEQQPGEQPEQPQETPAPQEGEEPDDEEAGEGAAAREQDRRLTRDEAERLLQSVRDKERERREQLERQRAAGRRRVEKDW